MHGPNVVIFTHYGFNDMRRTGFPQVDGGQRDPQDLRRHRYYDAFDSNMNMTILANTYYEKLPGNWSNYFKEEDEKIKTKDVDTLGAKIDFLKKRLTELCTQRYIIKGARNGENIFYDKIDNILGK